MPHRSIRIALDQDRSVSGLLQMPTNATACTVLAHGAGAGMTHPFMAAVSAGLSDRRIATLRFQFPSMEAGSRRPDRPAVAQVAVRAAIQAATALAPDLPLFAGGKSFGGRMTSQAQALDPLPGVVGLIFLGFPLHPQRKPSTARAAHLGEIAIPMLFLQGSRDGLAELPLLGEFTRPLGRLATLSVVEHADHGFHVPARSGLTDVQVMSKMLDVVADWVGNLRSS